MSDQVNVVPDEDVNYVTVFEFRRLLIDMLVSGKASDEFRQWVERVVCDAWEDAHDGLTDEIVAEVEIVEAEFLLEKLQRQQQKLHELSR